MSGAIIIISGGPGLGKSTLTKLLAKHFQGTAILEGEEKDFPARIIESLSREDRGLEIGLYFRNKRVEDYQKAMQIKQAGGLVFLDTYWLTNDIYTDVCIPDQFEKQLMLELSDLDQASLPAPDCLISLSATNESIIKFLEMRNRSYEGAEEVRQRYFNLNQAHEKFFRQKNLPYVEFLDRSEMDFYQEEDFQKVVKLVENKITPQLQ